LKEILFYIFSSITLLAAVCIAFSVRSGSPVKALPYFITGLAGFFVLLNFHLYSFLSVLISLMIFSCLVLLNVKTSKFVIEVSQTFKVNIISLIILSILTAIFAGLLGAAKWQKFDVVLTETKSFNMTFSKYLAAILAVGLITSVIISTGIKILKGGMQNDGN